MNSVTVRYCRIANLSGRIFVVLTWCYFFDKVTNLSRLCLTLAQILIRYSLYTSPPGLTVFTLAPLTSTHRQFWVYCYFERLLLEGLQCYRQHLSTRCQRRCGRKSVYWQQFLDRSRSFSHSIYLCGSGCMCDSAVSVPRSRLGRDAIYWWWTGTTCRCLQVQAEITQPPYHTLAN